MTGSELIAYIKKHKLESKSIMLRVVDESKEIEYALKADAVHYKSYKYNGWPDDEDYIELRGSF